MVYKVTLKDLTATSVQNIAGEDEIFVMYHVDNSDLREPYYQRKDFDDDGDEHDLERVYSYDAELSVTLYEEDLISNDLVGTGVIDDTRNTTDSITISGSGAEYELDYEVEDVGNADHAEIAVDDFEASNEWGQWSHVTKSKVISALRDYVTPPDDSDGDGVDDVFGIDQGSLGYCSMTAIAFGLAFRQPRRFVELCRAIYERGIFLTRTTTEMISGELLRSPKPNGIDHLEWLVTSSLRDSYNFVDSVTDDDLQEGGNSTFEKYWYDELLGYEDASVTKDDAGEATVRNTANTALNNNGVAILGVHGAMVDAGRFLNTPGNKPVDEMSLNHSVTLVRNFNTAGTNTQYSIHTWGDRVDVTHPTNILDAYLYEAITGSQ